MGTWNVRSMNQGKLEVVKQEMARLNIDILGISELKCPNKRVRFAEQVFISSWYRLENRGSERVHKLPNVAQPAVRIQSLDLTS